MGSQSSSTSCGTYSPTRSKQATISRQRVRSTGRMNSTNWRSPPPTRRHEITYKIGRGSRGMGGLLDGANARQGGGDAERPINGPRQRDATGQAGQNEGKQRPLHGR